MKRFTKFGISLIVGIPMLCSVGISSHTADATSNKMIFKNNSFIYTSNLKRTSAYKTQNGVRYVTRTYVAGTTVTPSGTRTINGKQYYQVGNNKYVRASNLRSLQDFFVSGDGWYLSDVDNLYNDDGSINQSAMDTTVQNYNNDTSMYWVDDSRSNNKLIKSARKLIGYFHYGNHAGFGNWKNPNKNGTTDCSGFVWLAMKRAGYPVGNWPLTTKDMENDARGAHHYLKQIPASQARMGDVMIVNTGNGLYQNGHAAIVDGPYEALNTQIIQMGGDSSSQSVHRWTLGSSLSEKLLKGKFTYARPVRR